MGSELHICACTSETAVFFDNVNLTTAGVVANSVLQVLLYIRGEGWPAFIVGYSESDLDSKVKAASASVLNALGQLPHPRAILASLTDYSLSDSRLVLSGREYEYKDLSTQEAFETVR